MDAKKRRRSDRTLRRKMRSPGRPSAAQRAHRQKFWRAIAEGSSTEGAARAAGMSPAVGARWFRHCGGMAPSKLHPTSGRFLSFEEREEIALLRVQGHGVRWIARHLGRAPSTISRELRRNAAPRGGNLEYRATAAQWHADRRAKRPKVSKLAANEPLRKYVQERLGGSIATPGGAVVPGPEVRWTGTVECPRFLYQGL
jgi:transposase-like protein